MKSIKFNTINLIDYRDVSGDSNNIILHESFNNIIKDKLDKGLFNDELICTQELRGIGKTYQLINFAKKHNYNVVVPTVSQANDLKKQYIYNKIYSQCDCNLINKDIVIDELVDVKELVKNKNCNIITGFITSIDKENLKKETIENEELKIESLQEKVIQSLEKDAENILIKLNKHLENNNDSNYKMLINNLRETMELINTLKNKSSKNITISNVTINKPTDASDFVNELTKLVHTSYNS